MTRKQYLVINRFADADADYGRYLRDDDATLTIITTPEAASWVTQDDRISLKIVPKICDSLVMTAINELMENGYSCDGIASLSEHDVILAAKAREALRAPGYSMEFARSFKDKVVMKERIQAAGIRAPRYLRVEPGLSAADVVAYLGYPVVWKPTSSAGSAGVALLHCLEEVRNQLQNFNDGEFECEEYISDEIFHIDGVVRDGKHLFCQVSRYAGTPLHYLQGHPVGSYTVEVPEAQELTHKAIAALELFDGVYHLEAMRAKDGSLVFLEVGLRPGGSEIVRVARENSGVDLFEETFRAALGLRSHINPALEARPLEQNVGWVIFPGPRSESTAGISAESLRDRIPEIYSESLCNAEDWFDVDAGYSEGPAQYRLRADNSADVERAVKSIIAAAPVSGLPSPTEFVTRISDQTDAIQDASENER